MTGRSGSPERPATRFHEALLGETITWAIAHCPFYRERFEGLPVPQTPSELSPLPLTWKHELRSAGWRARAGHLTPALRQHTSGSTATSFEVYRSREELEFVGRFIGSLYPTDSSAPRTLELFLGNPAHGGHAVLPSPSFVIQGNVYDGAFLPHLAASVLLDSHEIPGVEPRVTRITGALTHVAAMTAVLRSTGMDFSAAKVATLSVTGFLMTNRWRRLLEDSWRCYIENCFSLTEVFGWATHCEECDAFHFGPEVVPEVVDVVTRQPLEEGRGMLALTSLYPFVQMQPIIRYVTGDVASIVPTRCRSDYPAHRLEGRLSHAWLATSGQIVLPGVDIINALDGEALVARGEVFRDWYDRFPIARELGPPMAELVTSGDDAALRILCRFDPLMYPSEAKELTGRLASQVAPAIRSGFRDKLTIQLHGPGAAIAGYKPSSV